MKDNYNNSNLLSEVFINKNLLFIKNLENFIKEPTVENIHQSRVAGRRLESVFGAFGKLSNTDYTSHFSKIAHIIKLLSNSREADVCISMTRDYCKQIKEDDPVLISFLNHLIRNSKYQRKMVQKNSIILDFIKDKDAFIESIMYDLTKRSESITLINAKQYFRTVIPELYDTIFRYSEAVKNNPSDKKRLHKMRLKAKPLRYIVEFANEVFNVNLDAVQKQIKEFVEQAGLIHDIDMLIERIDNFTEILKKMKYKDNLLYRNKSLNVFRKFLNSKRKEEYRLFCELILKLESGNTKQLLMKQLD